MFGLFATLAGAILASVKTIVTNKLQAGNFKFHPLELLYHMSPLAFIQCMFWAAGTGEVKRLYQDVTSGSFGGSLSPPSALLALIANGAIAFGLNYVSFTANGKTSPLMMCVAGKLYVAV